MKKFLMGSSLVTAIVFSSWPKPKPIVPLLLSNFHEIKTISDDVWNNHKDGETCYSYYRNESDVPVVDKTTDPHYRYNKVKYSGIGYIQYRQKVGQIGLIRLDEGFRNKTLGKQMLEKAIVDMKENDVKEVWAVTSKNHSFWSNVYNRSFKWRDPAHNSVTGSGYYMKI